MSLPSHMTKLGSLKPSDPVVTSVPAADWDESDSDSPSFIRNKPEGAVLSAALSFGQKTYDGSAAKTITAADLGALTAHQDISGKADKSTTYTKTETDSAISAAISSVKDSAPAAFDTLKEIADWIGDSGSGAQAVINQVAGKANKVASATTGNFAGLDANGNLTDSGKKAADFATAAQGAKADAALSRAEAEAGFTAWEWGEAATAAGLGQPTYNTYDENGYWWIEYLGLPWSSVETGEDATELHFEIDSGDLTTVIATRTRLPTMADIPTDNAQLANGAGYATTAAMNVALAGKADAASLPYALVDVTPTAGAPFVLASCFPIKYTLSDEGATETTVTDAEDVTIEGVDEGEGVTAWKLIIGNRDICFVNLDGTFDLLAETASLTFGDPAATPTADTTPVLGFTPTYALADRTTNQVVVASPLPENGIALAFPDATAGKVRDFLVRLEIPAGDAPQIAYPEGVTFENADGEFPEIAADANAACATLLMFTETRAATTGAGATPACFLVKGEKLTAIAAGGAS